MLRRLTPAVVTVGFAAAVLTACTGDGDGGWATGTSTTATSSPAGTVDGEVPLAHDGGYWVAVDRFGAEEVAAAVESAATVAHIALADCHRWTTGDMDPRLAGLVTPELLARSLDELDRAPEYGAVPVPSLLSHLPSDDGNGNDEASDVLGGCDDTAPLRFPFGSMRVRVDHGSDDPRLEVTGEFVTELTFGSTRVGAGQDWTFLSTPTGAGWLVSDASVVANVNWFPAPPA